MLLTRLRWSAFGLRGRIVGAVVVTTAVSLGVAALVLLPRLQTALKNAAVKTLETQVKAKKNLQSIERIAGINYELIPFAAQAPATTTKKKKTPLQTLESEGLTASKQLSGIISELELRFGNSIITLFGPLDSQGYGTAVNVSPGSSGAAVAETRDIRQAYLSGKGDVAPATVDNRQFVRAVIPLKKIDAVLAVRKSIDQIPGAVAAVRRAFEIAALVAIILTLFIAIPLAGTLVRRLQRLRQAALQLAVGGNVDDFPADRARDEIGDLARSFSIMQRRLRQQEEARRAFVATASHELRTPLASLNGMLELLADDLQADDVDLEDAAALLTRARAQSRRLSRLAADLLDLSRIDADVALRSELLELGELGRAVLAEFELASASRGVNAVLEDESSPVWTLADPGSVARILRILLDNALRVAPRGSEVKVVVRASPQPTIIVSDRGPGVAPEERALIFERFKRGRETGGEAGFGLGLAIGRELAQRMGGELVIATTAEPGATFVLHLRPTGAPSSDRLTSAAGV
jgi:signal transduction histidine kinase